MISQQTVGSLEESLYFKGVDGIRAKMGLPATFDSRPPMERVRLLATCGADSALVGDFLRLRPKAITLRPVAGSLRCVTTGFH